MSKQGTRSVNVKGVQYRGAHSHTLWKDEHQYPGQDIQSCHDFIMNTWIGNENGTPEQICVFITPREKSA